jgi:hypothetical protein
VCGQGAELLLGWHDTQMGKSGNLVDPLLTVLSEGGPFHTKNQLEVFCKRLEESGRGHYAEILRAKHKKR